MKLTETGWPSKAAKYTLARGDEMTQYRLPCGKTTKSPHRYVKAWRDIADPIAKATGSKLRGFDPGFTFGNNDTPSFDLATSIAIKLSAALLKGPL
jgi:hypothetical protein